MPSDPVGVAVDGAGLKLLFIEKLGWASPKIKQPVSVTIDETTYSAKQIAEYRGLGVWFCPAVPSMKHQRAIDREVTRKNTERLIIFGDDSRQEWRWPRYTGHRAAANPRLVSHTHVLGEPDSPLEEKLRLITIDPSQAPTVPDLLSRMREAFDEESERASVAAARRMGALYEHLEAARVAEEPANRLLARLLFLMFGDDTGMWERNLFHNLIADHSKTDGSDLKQLLDEVFLAADTPEKRRPATVRAEVRHLPYINGGLFKGPVDLPAFNKDIRDALLDASKFDWGQISPAVFGAIFQTVKSKEARRAGGEHYTSEANILKTIGPLFLEELRDRFEAAWDDKGQLTKLHNHLKDLRFMDPACGCGNFLIVAFRELRALELEILKRRRDLDQADGQWQRSQMLLEADHDVHVRMDHFFGIEIESWPARIAQTAMFLVNHQANQRMEQELGVSIPMLPLTSSATIHEGNALRTDWAGLVEPSSTVYIFGNPPFTGQYSKTPAQKQDAKFVWGKEHNGYLDYVTCWHKKTLDFYSGTHDGRWGFVTTNSVNQGEAAAVLWRAIRARGWRCRFAHRSFAWESDAPGKAAVHVSIVGYDRGQKKPTPMLWIYPEGGRGEPLATAARNINPYLIDHADVFVSPTTKPLCGELPALDYGNKPTDGGNLVVEPASLDAVLDDPIAAQFVRRYVGARELLNNRVRHCLWLVDASPAQISGSPVLSARVKAVRQMRLDSTKSATRKKSATPQLFDEIRQPTTKFLAIPSVVSEHRPYFAAAYFGPEVICSNLTFTVPDPDGLVLGVLSSAMFMAWQKAIGGRLESRIRFSNTFSYNTFPLLPLATGARAAICEAARSIIRAREAHPGKSLAQLYNPGQMPSDLLAAHRAVDAVLDPLFGLGADPTTDQRQDVLFDAYQSLVAAASDSRQRRG